MECPFCAEEIREAALVCKHCSRDLKVPEPLIEEHAELTAKLAELEQEVGGLRAELERVRRPVRLWGSRK